ncbi:hypothetical protein K505DRAFT_327083 [Melanomma pulvis-pyrius CBS 109.77]|uniref:Uncharacterized protein n=1 Tax=Melanomma pulvis-pyrius CBS 109.77 TaxID=1314802 RepID=A0A6A6X445_9PLEO|nr:hypothetical protein K505DRAFT_327083 [Melanomma pulvis-pyrius CBS 109.77]
MPCTQQGARARATKSKFGKLSLTISVAPFFLSLSPVVLCIESPVQDRGRSSPECTKGVGGGWIGGRGGNRC